MPNIKELVSDIMAAPLGDIISAVGRGVADAQQALDRGSLAQLLEIYSHADTDELKLLQQIGYQPTFYALPETTGEIQVALSISGQTSNTPAPTRVVNQKSALLARLQPRLQAAKLYAAPVNADLTNRYGFQSSAAARIVFKIVPVPAPGQVSEIRVVPNLVGMPFATAQQLAAQLDLELLATDAQGNPIETTGTTAGISEQQPAAGEITLAGNSLQVQLKA